MKNQHMDKIRSGDYTKTEVFRLFLIRRNFSKSLFAFFLCILAAGMLLPIGCSSGTGSDSSTISISLGKLPAQDKAAVSIDQLRHTITLSGPTGTQTHTIMGAGTVKATVFPGVWYINVQGFWGDELYSVGSTSTEVKAWKASNVSIQMTVVWDGAGGGEGHTYTVTFKDYYGANVDLKVPVNQGDTVTKPTDPTKTAEAGLYSGALSALPTINFGDWYDGITLFNFTTPINSDISLTATWSPSSPLIDLSTTPGATIVDKAVTYANANPGDYTLFLDASVSVPGGSRTLNGKLTLIGLTSERTILLTLPGNMFVISGTGSALTLGQNITLQGMSNNTALVQVSSDGTLTMETGARITGNTNGSGGNGGGVEVTSTGTFTMNGGIISGNYANATGGSGAGVYVNGGGASFAMQGSAEVSGNTAFASGAGVYVASGGFTMDGNAKVTTNRNTQISSKGGGVYVSNGNFTMNDSASVSNQILDQLGDGAGVYLDNSTLTMNNNSTVSGNAGSNGNGVYAAAGSTFTMYDNTSVSGNSKTGNGGGGGVYVDGSGSTFTMWGNASVSNNTAQDGGGGVDVENNAAFIMESGSVSGNTVNNGGGGGVWLFNGTFTMKGGTVSGNTATGGTGNGGGVCVYGTGGAFQISDGTVYGNDVPAPLANSASSGTALYAGAGTTVEHGISGTWTPFGTLPFIRENTIVVIAGFLQP